MCKETETTIIVKNEFTETFKIEKGVRQRCVMSPSLFYHILHESKSQNKKDTLIEFRAYWKN